MAKQKIRIALAIDSNGKWTSSGWGSGFGGHKVTDSDKMEMALEMMDSDGGERRYWIECEVDLPEEIPVVLAAVAAAEAEEPKES